MRDSIDAIAFDIDGTLYPDTAFTVRLLPFLLTNLRFMITFGQVRSDIRVLQEKGEGFPHPDFFGLQASLFARRSGLTEGEARSLIDRKIYQGWRPLFEQIKPFPHLPEAFHAFHAAGLKIGIMSDFLPDQKGDIWGLRALSDAVLGSEETGALKPSPVPFLVLAEALGVKPERVLYVGNSLRSDVQGARAAGMKTACIRGPLSTALRGPVREADISFSAYRQLVRNVLK